MKTLRYGLALTLLLALSGCDALWPFGNPNAPQSSSETAERVLGHAPDVKPIAPQAGNVWPGPVQPVPTLADIEKNMNEPLGQAYAPSLPSPYPLGQVPPEDKEDDMRITVPPDAVSGNGPAAAPVIAPGNPHLRE